MTNKKQNQSLAEQIELEVKAQRAAQENPDLTYEFIKNILIAQQEIAAGKVEEYQFNEPER